MGSIRTAIELQDNFTGILMNVINAVNMSVSTIEQMQSTMNEPIDTASIQGIRAQLNQATLAAQELDAAMQNVDAPTSDVNPATVEVPVVWYSDNLDVFTNTGMERFEQETAGVNAMLEELCETQQRISQQAGNADILSPQAAADIQDAGNRMQALQEMVWQVENNPLNMGTDSANAQLERLMGQLDQAADLQDALNQAMQEGDLGEINAAYLQLSQRISDTERLVRDSFSHDVPPLDVAVTWHADTLDVFTGEGIERFGQEVQSANNMLDTLNQTQAQIAARAAQTSIFPSGMAADMGGMQNRLQAIQERIQAIESSPLNMGTDTANAELEQLRAQLNQAVQQQELMNNAVENMDVQAANEAYLRLSQTVGNTERYIRDNVDEQGRFNREIQEGTNEANELMRTIKGAATAYLTLQTVASVLGLSDELIQTEARLSMMNDGVQTTNELINMVYASAQNARGSFQEMADVVARFGNNAGDAFGSTAEVIAFAELVQKQMTIAGASTQEASNAMLQLSQSLGSGVLRGDELNSIFEQAPNLIQNIADYLGVSIGSIREMASEGQLTADIVKAAMFSATDEINANFEAMPMTWGQMWQSFQNTAIIAFRPVLQRINEIANSKVFQEFVEQAVYALAMISSIVLGIFDAVAAVGGFVADNWSVIEPIVMGIVTALGLYYGAMLLYNTITGISTAITAANAFAKQVHAASLARETGATFAATAAQYGFNAALLACPITWIIIAIIAVIALIYAVVAAVNKFAGTSVSATGIICGAFMVALAFIGNLFVTLINFVIDIFVVLGNFIAAFANFLWNVSNDVVGAIARLFFDLVDTVLSLLQTLAGAIDTIFGSNLSSAVQGWRDSLSGWVGETFGQGEEIMAKMDASSMHWERFEYGAAWDAGYSFGEGIDESISNFDPSSLFGTDDIPLPEDYAYSFDNSGIGEGIDNTAWNTGAMADAMEITGEELKYLRDIAEQEAVNRFTTAEINIEQTNHNTIKNGMDLDGVISGMTDAVNEAIEISTEGVHD